MLCIFVGWKDYTLFVKWWNLPVDFDNQCCRTIASLSAIFNEVEFKDNANCDNLGLYFWYYNKMKIVGYKKQAWITKFDTHELNNWLSLPGIFSGNCQSFTRVLNLCLTNILSDKDRQTDKERQTGAGKDRRCFESVPWNKFYQQFFILIWFVVRPLELLAYSSYRSLWFSNGLQIYQFYFHINASICTKGQMRVLTTVGK